MQHLLLALNAKYIHSNLAVRSLYYFDGHHLRYPLAMLEMTVNHRLDDILSEVYRRRPDALYCSCYLWNIALVAPLCAALRQILPGCLIALGGPEVSYDSADYLRSHPDADLILRGEGEETFGALLDCLESGGDLSGVQGIAYRAEDGRIVETPDRPPLDLARLPFPYASGCEDVREQILYYESSRGCPFGCSYCLSSIDRRVRFAPLEQVQAHLQRFLDARVRQVKFVDRTFNCDRAHAMSVWRYLSAHDNGVTNFHFELSADLLDDEMLAFLRTARPGLFQFEIGVQSTHPDTLRAIRRPDRFDAVAHAVKAVKQGHNIHQHLDLIAGLPFENYAAFGRSFNDVYALEPEQLQLGFLKVLKGSPLYAQCGSYSILYRPFPPYEVLSTRWLSYGELQRLAAVEAVLELYYNSGRFQNAVRYLAALFDRPFAFYEALADHWIQGRHHLQGHNPVQQCDVLYEFAGELPGFEFDAFGWRLKLDLCLHGKLKKLPAWLTLDHNAEYRSRILDFYADEANLDRYLPQYRNCDPRYIYRMAHIEVFGTEPGKRQALLFDYDRRTLGGQALCHRVEL